MTLFSMLVIYLLTWSLSLFVILPLGIQSQIKSGDIVPGTDPGAPVASQIWQKFKLNSLVASCIWAVICVIIHFELIDLQSIIILPIQQDSP